MVPSGLDDRTEGGLTAPQAGGPSVKVCYSCLDNREVSMESNQRFGFVSFAETWNGRLAMLGFVIGLATELLTGQGILSQIGLG